MKVSKETIEGEVKWLRSIVSPLQSVEMYSDNKDLKPLKESIKNAKIVALGEVTHGSSDIFKMKDKIIKYLVEKEGFDTFAIEANMPEAYRLNDYILRGEGNPKKLIEGMYFWTWQTSEMLDLVNWMKAYNNNHTRKVTFTGFDMQFSAVALTEVSRLFDKYNRTKLDNLLDTFGVKLGELDHAMRSCWRTHKKYHMDNAMRTYLKGEFSYLHRFGNKNIYKTEDKEWFMQNVRVLEQSAGYVEHIDDEFYGNYRDKCMAENLLWISAHTKEDSKIIVWAHNGHVQKAYGSMGSHLAKKLKQRYFVVGSTFYQGNYSAYGKKGLSSYPAQKAYPGTYEYYFHLVGEPLFLLDLKDIPPTKAANELFNGKTLFRQTGQSPTKEEFEPTDIRRAFDMLIFIDKSTSSHLFRR